MKRQLLAIILLGLRSLKWILPILSFLVFNVISSVGIIKISKLTEFSRKITPEILWQYKFGEIGFASLENFRRIQIWNAAINFIIERPLWGWGGASFPVLFELANNEYKGHAHNFPLEIAVSFGIPTALIITFSIITIMFLSAKKVLKIKNKIGYYSIDIAWWVACFSIFLSQ